MDDPEDRSVPPPWADDAACELRGLRKAEPGSPDYKAATADAWTIHDSITADLRAENASLRQRLAFNREREARQALLWTAIDLRESAVLEIEHATGRRITAKRMEALTDALRPVLEEHDYKLKTWGTRAKMRLAFGRQLAEQALRDTLDKMKGRSRRGS